MLASHLSYQGSLGLMLDQIKNVLSCRIYLGLIMLNSSVMIGSKRINNERDELSL